MQLADITKRLLKVTVDNSPAILTAAGITGLVSTGFLAHRAGKMYQISYDQYVKMVEENPDEDIHFDWFDPKDRVKILWTYYLPVISVGSISIACILGANHVSSRRNAALISAYSLSETAFKEYKEKVVETLGAKKDEKIRDEVAQDRVTKNPPSGSEIFITGSGEVLCYESLSGRYFKSTAETIRRAENDINRQINQDMYASLNEFWNKIGLPSTSMGEELGWNIDAELDVVFSAVLDEESKPCIAIGYRVVPIRSYHKIF